MGRPITVSSGYRSPALNTAVGGARSSAHVLGLAADITVFARFQMHTTGISYIVGGGGKGVERSELIIYSWDREAEPAGLF